jgi:mitochondrial inner membrane protease ATP23
VKRRALKSVQRNPFCSSETAKDAIETVWDICYHDTMPFDRAP